MNPLAGVNDTLSTILLLVSVLTVLVVGMLLGRVWSHWQNLTGPHRLLVFTAVVVVILVMARSAGLVAFDPMAVATSTWTGFDRWTRDNRWAGILLLCSLPLLLWPSTEPE